MAVEHLARPIVKLTRHKAAPVALKPEVKLWIRHAEKNETVGRREPSSSKLVLENERDCSEGGVFYVEPHGAQSIASRPGTCSDSDSLCTRGTGNTKAMVRSPK